MELQLFYSQILNLYIENKIKLRKINYEKKKNTWIYEIRYKRFWKKGKQSTVKSKKEIFTTHILPYFGKMKNKRYNTFNY